MQGMRVQVLQVRNTMIQITVKQNAIKVKCQMKELNEAFDYLRKVER